MAFARTEMESCTDDTSIYDGRPISPLVKKLSMELKKFRKRKEERERLSNASVRI